MSNLIRAKSIKSSKLTKKKSMKRNNKKSIGLNIMRGGSFGLVLKMFESKPNPNKFRRFETVSQVGGPSQVGPTPIVVPVAPAAPAPIGSSTNPSSLVAQIASQVSAKKVLGLHTVPVVQKSNTLYNTIKKARDAVINLKKNRQTSTTYKTDLSAARKEKQSLRRQDLVLYKQVKKDMSKAKKQKH